MLIATDDAALAVQIHVRVGAEVRAGLDVEDIAEFRIGWDLWMISPDYLLEQSWMRLALLSRGAILADSGQSVDHTIRRSKIAQQQAQAVHEISPTYVGDLHPDVVFVGERPNPAATLPLMTFQPGHVGCGDFLFQALAPVFAAGYRVGLVNAYYQNRRQELSFGLARYVALGQVADDYLTEIGVEHARVDHPQYVRRFHHDKGLQYSAHLLTAAATSGPFIELIR